MNWTHPDSGRIVTTGDVLNDMLDEIEQLREQNAALDKKCAELEAKLAGSPEECGHRPPCTECKEDLAAKGDKP